MMNYIDLFKLKGKNALVIGGVGLIGGEVSKALANAGAHVLIADIVDEKATALAAEIKKSGGKAIYIQLDVTKTDTYKEWLETLMEEHGDLHILVNLAYPHTKDWGAKVEDVSAESWRKNVEMQLDSNCLLSKELAALMKGRGIKGSIITIGSTYGVVGPDFSIYTGDMTMPAAYAAIKGGIITFTKYLASYYGRDGIRVNCLCPGGIYNNHDETFVKKYSARTCLGRMGKPEEMAAAIVFLAADASSYVTGSTFMVDGGWTTI